MWQIVSVMKTGKEIPTNMWEKQVMRMKKMGNSGFSLVEFIIAIAIIAIMTVGSISAFGYLNLANASKCTAKIDNGLTSLKSRNMAKTSSTYMHLYYYDDEYFILFNDASSFAPTASNYSEGEKVGNDNLKIFFDGADLSTVANNCVSIGVRRKDGAFTNTATPTSTIQVVKASDSGTAHEITLVTSTGKHFID